MKDFLLVDVSAIYFRAFYAIRHLNNSKGMPTNAIYGFLTSCIKMLDNFDPKYMAFCFDRKEPTFRKEKYAEYKANRAEMPEDLVPQVPYIQKIAEAMGAKCLSLEGYEADDIIGMLAKWGEKEGLHPVIVSGDKDFAQLINDKTNMFEPMKEVYYGPKEVKEKWGVRPDQIRDYLGLVGDSSDNIPGVRGIGPKGAQKLLNEYDSLEEIYENLAKIKNKNLQKKLEENKENAFLSKDLVTIITENHVMAKELEDFRWQGFIDDKLKPLLEELEFNKITKKLYEEVATEEKTEEKKAARGKELPDFDYKELKGHFPTLKEDYLSKEKIKIVQDAKKLDSKEAVFAYRFENQICLAQKNQIFILKPEEFLSLPKLSWKGFDVKNILRKAEIFSIKEVAADLQLMAYTYSSKDVKNEDFLIKSHFEESEKFTETIEDRYLALLVIEKALNQLLKKQKVHEIYEKVELPLVEILLKMEKNGILLDVKELENQKEEILKVIEKLSEEIKGELEADINLDSPKQLSHALFEVKGLPVIKKTKTGYSTDSDVLEKLSIEHPFCKKIIEYRELKKLLNTYVEALPRLADEKTKKIHSHFNQAVTTTGRLSSSNPNLQNIPIRSERGSAVRKAFVAEKGCSLIAADYSQIELRVLAHITEDPALIKAFNEDLDIHALTASEVFSVKLKEVDDEMRRKAKAINFGIAYGMGAYTLAENLAISRSEAKEIIATYFDRFKNVKTYMNEIVEKAKKDGYVESIFGRRRYIEEIHSKKPNIQKFGERAAINAPIQSSASDIIKKAMIEVDKTTKADLILQVHDELIFQIKDEDVEKEVKTIQESMEKAVQLKTALKVNVGVGKNWKEAH